MPHEPEDNDIWHLGLAALCDRIGSPDMVPAPGETAMIAALLGLQQIRGRLTASAERLGKPIGENPFGPLVEAALRLDYDLRDHVGALRIVADDTAGADRGGKVPAPVLQAAVEMPLNATQTCVEALALAQRAAALGDAEAAPAIQGGAELLAAAARTMLDVVVPLIGRLPDAALAAQCQRSVDHFGPALQNRYREVEDLTRRRAL